LLRIGDGRLPRTVAEKMRVEVLGVGQFRFGADVKRILGQRRRHARRRQFGGGQDRDRFDPVPQIAPELGQIFRPGETSGHADNCDRLAGLGQLSGPRPVRACDLAVRREIFGQRLDGRMLEQLDDGQLALEQLAQAGMNPAQNQRMPAQVEKVILRSDMLDGKEFLPDTRNRAFQFTAQRSQARLRGRGSTSPRAGAMPCGQSCHWASKVTGAK
jgi:hypothetical protein